MAFLGSTCFRYSARSPHRATKPSRGWLRDEESYDHQLDQDEHAEEDDDGPDGVSGTFAAASDFEKFEQFLQYGGKRACDCNNTA